MRRLTVRAPIAGAALGLAVIGNATWDAAPGGVVSWGYTVMRTRQKLAADLQYALGRR